MRPNEAGPPPQLDPPLKTSPVFYIVSGGIILFLIALLLPTFQGGGSRPRSPCKTNLKQIGLALHNYHSVVGHLPAQLSTDPACSWRITLLPYLEQEELYRKYDRKENWSSVANWPYAFERVKSYICPENPVPQVAGKPVNSAYAMPVGEGTVFQGTRAPKFADITDGLSNTLLVVEACDQKIIWTEPRDVLVDASRLGVNQASGQAGDRPPVLSSGHQGGANTLLGDGAVRALSEGMDQEVLRRLMLARDGLPVGKF